MCSPAESRRPATVRHGLIVRLAPLVAAVAVVLAVAVPAHAESFKAPTRLFQVPAIDSLATLPGDYVEVRYPLGALDRAARVQARLNEMLRHADAKFQIIVYMLNREQWLEARFDMPYGVPVRVGPSALAVPAGGDAETAALWNQLQVPLPSVAGVSYRGGPGHASSELMAEVLAMILAGEIYAELAGIAGDEYWLRGLVSHLVVVDYLRRAEPALKTELDLLYRQVRGAHAAKVLAASDYRPTVDMADWMWFQAAFHAGAATVFEEEGRGVFRRLGKLAKRNGGVVTSAAVLDRWDDLRTWYDRTFSAVSRRPIG